MDVYLNSKDIPKRCWDCPFVGENDYCILLPKDVNESIDSYDEQKALCPLLPMESEVEKRKKLSPQMKVVLDSGAYMPTRAHDADAGLDLYASTNGYIRGGGSLAFDTGVHVEIPVGYVGMLKSKSGLNCRHGLTSEGVIDAGYTGSIVVKLYNHSETDYVVNAGDKISQLVILPILSPVLKLVDSLEDTERGNGGFGSTGK